MTHRFRFTCTRLLPACALAALLVGPPGFAPSANAADVTYPGSNLDKGPLWNIDNSLFPAGSLSDNVVTINSGNVGGDVYGNDVDAAFSPVSNNTVILSGGSVGGDLLCMFAQLSYATYFVVFKGLIGRYGPVTLMKWMFLFATLCWLPFGAEDFVSTRWQAFGWRNFAEVGFIVLGATFLTYLLLPVGQKNLRPTVGCMYNYLQPLVASLVAVLAGMDRFTTIKAAAVVLVFAGVYAVTRSKSKAQMDAEASRR